MYKLCFYVPETHLEPVKQALFEAGAGRMGDYDRCYWQALGQGQFRPLSGSNPFLGQVNCLKTLPEWKVELVIEDALIHQVIDALKASHPYETPAFEVWHLSDLAG